jgi:hypothetical protein
MKGVVFTEFLDMVEEKFGDQMVDDIIEASDLSTDGAYTAIGTYPHDEIITLVVNLGKYTKIPVPDLVYVFGKHLFGRFTVLYSNLLEGYSDAFTFLEGIENYIHVEVKKLYPDAQLPFFNCSRDNDNLIMNYKSERAMADLAHGLMEGSFEHFKEKISVRREDTGGGDGTSVRFYLKKEKQDNLIDDSK